MVWGGRRDAVTATAGLLAGAGAVGVAAATVAICALDRRGVAAGYDIVHHTLSEALWRPGGLWFAVALEVLAVGIAAIVVGMAILGEVRQSALIWLSVASGGLGLAGVVPTNRPLSAPVPGTYLHLGATVLAAAVLPLGAVAAVRRCPHQHRPTGAAATALAVAALPPAVYVAIVAILWMISTRGWEPLPLGMVQRILAADESLVVIVLGVHIALRARQVRARTSPGATQKAASAARRRWAATSTSTSSRTASTGTSGCRSFSEAVANRTTTSSPPSSPSRSTRRTTSTT